VSFRGRLTLFFLLIVVLPMIAVAVLVVQVTESSRSGKADARLAAGVEEALTLYRDDVQDADRAGHDVADDPALLPALESANQPELQAIADRELHALDLTSVVIKDASGRVMAAAGDRTPIAPARLLVNGGDLGSLEVSTQSPAGYLGEIRHLTGRDGAVLGVGGAPIASTLPLRGVALPPSGQSKDVELGGEQVRAATADLPPPGTFRVALFGPEESGGFLSSSPLVIAALLAFFAFAVLFVVMLLRALQGQVAAMLGAAKRIGEGDFSSNVPVVGHDEMAGLASEFNKMSSRLTAQMEELRRQRDELERSVRRIGEAFASGFDRRALLQIVVETALEACRADYGRVSVAGGDAAEAGQTPSGPLREAALTAEDRAGRDGAAAEARRESAHALSSPLRRMGNGVGTVGLMTVARIGEPFGASEREVFLYLVGQASASIENVALHELVSSQAVTDELTGLANNRRFREWIENEGARAQRFGHELSLLMLDVDDFKRVNDTYGHLQGDEVLRVLGRILRSESRGVDEPARYGGEEFAVGLPETGRKGAHELGERIRAKLEQERIPMVEGTGTLRVTASVGVASLPTAASDVASLVAAADSALYSAKRDGKNRVEVAPPLTLRGPASGGGDGAEGRAAARRT
jgi:diguanylate cyclase (GGDEF)-like protein